MSEYVAELRRLATTCEFGTFLNEALCDRLVCGLREKAMQRRLLAEPNLDLTKACEFIAQGMEAANRNAKEIQSKDSEGLVHSIYGSISESSASLYKMPWGGSFSSRLQV